MIPFSKAVELYFRFRLLYSVVLVFQRKLPSSYSNKSSVTRTWILRALYTHCCLARWNSSYFSSRQLRFHVSMRVLQLINLDEPDQPTCSAVSSALRRHFDSLAWFNDVAIITAQGPWHCIQCIQSVRGCGPRIWYILMHNAMGSSLARTSVIVTLSVLAFSILQSQIQIEFKKCHSFPWRWRSKVSFMHRRRLWPKQVSQTYRLSQDCYIHDNYIIHQS